MVLPTDGGAPLFFQPWLTGLRAGHFFSQYTPGWPAVLLAFDVVLGSPALALAVSAAAAVLAIYTFTRELTRDHVLALVAAGVMAASPIIAVQSGVYLGYYAFFIARYRWYWAAVSAVVIPILTYLVFELGFQALLPKSYLYFNLPGFPF